MSALPPPRPGFPLPEGSVLQHQAPHPSARVCCPLSPGQLHSELMKLADDPPNPTTAEGRPAEAQTLADGASNMRGEQGMSSHPEGALGDSRSLG